MRQRTVLVILAGGAGSRFGGDGHKLSATISSPGSNQGDSVIERSIHLLDSVTVEHNDHWNEGQITSLRRGIEHARSLGATSVVVGLADQPFIDPAAWQAVAEATGPIVVATYAGQRANPVKLDADVWELLPTTGDEGARALMRVRPELVREVACSGSPDDIDTTEDLRRWQSN